MNYFSDDDPLDVPNPKAAKRKVDSGTKDKTQAPVAKMKFSIGSKPKMAPLKISLGMPQVGQLIRLNLKS